MPLLPIIPQGQNPFAPPRAFLHYAPDRTCDLQHVAITLDIDYPNKGIKGHIVNTLSPLRNGITEVRLMAGTELVLSKVTVDGTKAKFRRDGRDLFITTKALTRGKPIQIAIDYSSQNSKAQPFGGSGGFHWINPRENGPATRVGFWTQGESEYNSNWAPTWDYPNDMTTSETTCTVQSDWTVIGNGILESDKLSSDKKKRTFHWVMKQPHATYLLTLVGGPLDIKKDKWRGVDLWYVVPKGEGKYIDDSFGDTPDMLEFFSNTLGVKYPWPKYAQNAMYDFGGGMENVSATTLGEGSLTEKRAGFRLMSSLNSHELGHQWFGDLVTCKDWGDTWLNESFATYMQMIYFEHSQGLQAYQQEVTDNINSYLAESRRYKRPISTKMYPNGDAMFDSHTYPKGGVVLHTLRRLIGDEAFYTGLNQYLTKHRHQPVESADLRRSLTEATGINMEPFWAQWFEKPGHPVLDYTWKEEGGKLLLTVKQTQDTSDGTPIYDIPTKAALITDSGLKRVAVHITKAEETFEFPGETAKAVVLDPDHDFLREFPNLHWSRAELPYIIKFAPVGDDKYDAIRKLLNGEKTPADIKLATDAVMADSGKFTAIRSISPLASLNDPSLRSFFTSLLNHPDFGRRAEAVAALGRLPQDPETTKTLRGLINAEAPIPVVVNAIQALARLDKEGNKDVFTKAQSIPSRNDRIKRVATSALGQ